MILISIFYFTSGSCHTLLLLVTRDFHCTWQELILSIFPQREMEPSIQEYFFWACRQRTSRVQIMHYARTTTLTQLHTRLRESEICHSEYTHIAGAAERDSPVLAPMLAKCVYLSFYKREVFSWFAPLWVTPRSVKLAARSIDACRSSCALIFIIISFAIASFF